MDQMWVQVGSRLLARVSGPLKFRLLLQPATAAFFAIRSGLRDAKVGKPPYFWSIVSDFSNCGPMLRSGWKDVGRVFLLALAMDVVYQLIVLHLVHAIEAIIVAVILAIVPYLILRGPFTRAAQRDNREIRNPPKQPPWSDAA